MSYERIGTKEIDCLCGKGRIQQILESNDWNQIREKIEIMCDDCKNKYIIISENFTPKPKHDYTIYYFKNVETGEKIKIDL